MSRPLLVAVAGGSGSGKSSLCAALLEILPPGAGAVLSEDWYYRDVGADAGFDPATFDFDDLAVRDHDLLIAHLGALGRGEGVHAPRYSFVRHAREAATTFVPATDVIFVEGAHILCRADLAAAFDLRVYLDTPDDIRLIRRILRDQEERGRSLASILEQYLRTVRPAQRRLITPSRTAADIVLSDEDAGVRAPSLERLSRLAAPLLAHPRLAALLRGGAAF